MQKTQFYTIMYKKEGSSCFTEHCKIHVLYKMAFIFLAGGSFLIMNISFAKFDFSIKFLEPATVNNYPVFVLRSVLGMQLRKMCCVVSRRRVETTEDNMAGNGFVKCADCMYSATCAYSKIFETIIPKENMILAGTERASHPFAFTQNSKYTFKQKTIDSFDFSITLFGEAIKYLPYIYAAFVRAGRAGVFKERAPFVITDVKCNGSSILIDEENIQTDIPGRTIAFEHDAKTKAGEVLVELNSPLRFKTNGRYTTDFTAAEFFRALHRRAKTLCTLYGDGNVENYDSNCCKVRIEERKLRWHDYSHYSARQKNAMELGGAVGSFKLSGEFSSMELFLLEVAQNCNAGKNTNFGLGQIKVWKNLQ